MKSISIIKYNDFSKYCLFGMAGLFFNLIAVSDVSATPKHAYEQAISLAAENRDREAISMLSGAIETLHESSIWRARMIAASALIDMRIHLSRKSMLPNQSHYASLVDVYIDTHDYIHKPNKFITGALATIFPGSGHIWLGRMKDGITAMILVWPMMILTFWAARRGMGPVTIFFCLITVWLWSGTVFSAVSLAEREGLEAYLSWWQGAWQASALQGKPW